MPAIRRWRVDLTLALCAAAGAQIVGVALPLVARRLINVAGPTAVSQSPESAVWWVAASLGLLALLRGALGWQQTMRGERAAQGVLAAVRSQMHDKLQHLSLGYFERRSSGKILVRFVGDANALKTWLARTMVGAPADLLLIFCILGALSWIQLDFMFVAATPLVLLTPVLLWINPKTRELTRAGRRSQSRLCGVLSDQIENAADIRARNGQDDQRVRARELIGAVADASTRRGRLDAWSQACSVVAATTALAAVVVWGVILSQSGAVGHGDLLAAVWLSLLVRGPVVRLAKANVIHQRARVAAERIDALLSRRSEPGWETDKLEYAGPAHEITLWNIGYRNPSGRWVLRDLSASIRGPGLTVIRDDTGAGATLLDLLVRLRRPHKGRMRLDGLDVRKLRVADVRRRLARVGTQGAAAAQSKAHAAAHVLDFDPTILADLREALARGPSALLVDDPTAGLNLDQKNRVTEWLRQTAAQFTVIAVSTDEAMLRISDRILNLADPGPPRSRRTKGGNGQLSPAPGAEPVGEGAVR